MQLHSVSCYARTVSRCSLDVTQVRDVSRLIEMLIAHSARTVLRWPSTVRRGQAREKRDPDPRRNFFPRRDKSAKLLREVKCKIGAESELPRKRYTESIHSRYSPPLLHDDFSLSDPR